MNFLPKIEYIEINTGIPKTVIFDSPPEEDPFNEEYTPRIVVTKSNNGRKQVQFNYVEKSYTLNFIFQSEATKAAYLDFYLNHAIKGGKFDYYPSNDELDFETFTLSDRGLSLKRPIPVGESFAGTFEYDFTLNIERVL
jgi:hypothetical protein